MEFWNSLLTEKSWKTLQELRKEPFHFILIGGWAVYLWTHQQKSQDIDIIIPDIKDLAALKQRYDLKKNDHLRKYEIRRDEIDIDIYVPYFSQLALPIEAITKETTMIEGFPVVMPEILLILKQSAEYDRGHSMKGVKDRIDIMTLLCSTTMRFAIYRDLLATYKLTHLRQRLKEIIQSFTDINYLPLDFKAWIRMKKRLLQDI